MQCYYSQKTWVQDVAASYVKKACELWEPTDASQELALTTAFLATCFLKRPTLHAFLWGGVFSFVIPWILGRTLPMRLETNEVFVALTEDARRIRPDQQHNWYCEVLADLLHAKMNSCYTVTRFKCIDFSSCVPALRQRKLNSGDMSANLQINIPQDGQFGLALSTFWTIFKRWVRA